MREAEKGKGVSSIGGVTSQEGGKSNKDKLNFRIMGEERNGYGETMHGGSRKGTKDKRRGGIREGRLWVWAPILSGQRLLPISLEGSSRREKPSIIIGRPHEEKRETQGERGRGERVTEEREARLDRGREKGV